MTPKPRPQVVQLYRSVRDAARHKKLRSVANPQEVRERTVALDTPQGQALLADAVVDRRLLACGEAQQHPAFCGIATCTAVLRYFGRDDAHQQRVFDAFDGAAGFPPVWFRYFGFGFADRLPRAAKAALNHHLKYDGMPLSAATALLTHAHGLGACTVKDGITPASLLEEAAAAVRDPGRVLIANYDRGVLLQRGTGHFAAVAAHHEVSGRVLLLEVNSYRYPSVWVDAAVLAEAVNTVSPGGTKRGYVCISADAAAAAAAAASASAA